MEIRIEKYLNSHLVWEGHSCIVGGKLFYRDADLEDEIYDAIEKKVKGRAGFFAFTAGRFYYKLAVWE